VKFPVGHVNVIDGRYVYMLAPDNAENGPLFDYTLMPTHLARPFLPEELANAELAAPFPFYQGLSDAEDSDGTKLPS